MSIEGPDGLIFAKDDGYTYHDKPFYSTHIDDSPELFEDGGFVDGVGDFFGDIWNWAKSDMGLSVIGGGVNALMGLWASEKNADNYRRASGGSSGPSAAELYDKRVAAHNASINAPMDMGIRSIRKK